MNKQKGLAPILIVILIAIVVGGYLLYQKQSKPTPQPITQSSPSLITSPAASNSADIVNWKTYKIEKYNFAFNYPADKYFKDKLTQQYVLQERNNQIIINQKIYIDGKLANNLNNIYTIYDASTTDKDNLLSWWKNNIKTEIGNYNIPNAYEARSNNIPFEKCIDNQNIKWEKPPALNITPKNSILKIPTALVYSLYMYYDFGKPFIIHSTYTSDGVCGSADDYLVYTSLSRLP